MSSVAHSLRRIVARGRTHPAVAARSASSRRSAPAPSPVPVDIAPNDPIIPFFQSAAGAVDSRRSSSSLPRSRRCARPASSWSCRS